MSADADANGSALTGLSAVVVETRQEDDVDKFEDVVNKVTEPFKQVHEIYTSNSDAIHAAITALASLGGDFGRALDNWVPVVDKVMDGLDGLAKSTAFPFVGVAVYLFKGVVQLETQRRENSKRARALILQMADMLGALLQLDGVQDPDLKDQKTGQTVGGRIQRLMSAIEGDIKDCGNLIDAYSKHSVASKFFFSGQYADKFKSRADGLVSRKGEIIFSLQIHNTVGIDAIQAEVRRTNQMLTKLIEVVDHPSERKDRLDRMMHDLGGRDKVLGDDALMTTVASAVIQSRASPNAALSADQTDGAKIAGKEDAILTATERHELRLPLDSVLEQNATLYVEKLGRQVEKITSQLDKLQSSSDVILKTLTGGAWERVEHPDLQQIWKDNDWKTSVEARYFVLVVHDYYDDFFRRPQPAAPTADTTSTDGKQPRFSVPTPSDIWCLKYLSVKHTGALMEVFDVDGSGFVRVAEVNDFCAAIPEGVNLLQWLAYWAHGWRGETAIYAHKIIGLLQKMRAMLDDVLLENNRIVQRYFQGSKWVKDLESLTYMAAQFPHSTGTPLDALIARAMDRKAAAQLPLLEKLYYTIDTPESVDLVCESLRLEVDILPLLYRILSHHAGLIVLCKTTVIDEREFTSAADTIKQVLRAVKSRVDKLDDGCEHMGVDPSSHFCRYAGGLYRYVHEGRAPGDSDDVFNEDFADDVDADLRNITNDAPNMRLRFGAFKLDTSGYTTAPSSTSLEDITVEAETPISPIAITPQTDFGLPAEAFVKKIYFRLDSLASHEHFHFVKPVAYLLRSISLKEHERRASQLPRRLILEIANTLNEVLKVRGVEDLDLVTDNGSSMLARLKDLMVKIERDLKDCGNLIKSFHRHNSNGSRIGATFSQKFKDRSEGLQRRQTDIIAALALPRLTGKARFRAVVRTIIAQIADANRHKTWEFLKSRRENRKRYVNLVTKQLEAAEIRTIWNVATSLSASEATELEDASRELLHGDWAYYQSLARAKHRKHWVHADRKCDSCGKMPIYGARYLCSVCDNFDLCSDCERDWANGHPHQITGSHDISHPLLKIVRPIIKVDRYVLASLNRIYRHVADGDGDSSSGSSVEFSDDEDPENALNESTTSSDVQTVTSNGNPTPSPSHRPWSFSEVEELPQNVKPWEESDEVETPVVSMTSSLELVTENSSHGEFHLTSAHARWQVTKLALETVIMADTVSEGHYHCVHCKEDKTGTRFIMTRDHRGKQLCPSCEAQLSKRHEFGPLPSYLALLLKCTIPSPMAPISMQTPRPAKAAELPPEDLETASVTAVGSHFSNVSIDRIASLEKDIHSIEERLSTILSAANR